ncbi:glycine betaine ABC transporter substrate-binding protein [Tomitella gaofuii]|uniref:glycine betaine ABC transporter substrate-binding protein n=1 Tax=Tomitella gaofuii TaxID=2760083 RepID=UPI0015FA8535|nr:glycine betaine ABC transporter substrate-binding protein [Tomitella gaofuii]
MESGENPEPVGVPARRKGRRRGLLTGAVAIFGAIAMVAAGCGSSDQAPGGSGGGGDETITIGYIAWDEDIALTNLFEQQLEAAGYDVKTTQLSAGAIFSGMANGDVDMFLDTWLPTTHKEYWDKYGAQLEDLGVWYDKASLELTVPSYVTDVNSIADLKDHADEFGGVITGIEPSAGIMNRAENFAVPEYGLEGVMKVQQSSTPAMLAELEKAISNKKPIVVTLWHPHWAYSRYDLKDLQDPKKAMGEAEKLHITARGGFSEAHPKIAEMASNFTMDDEHLQSLEDAINSAGKGKTADAVTQWTKDNQAFVDEKFGSLKQD